MLAYECCFCGEATPHDDPHVLFLMAARSSDIDAQGLGVKPRQEFRCHSLCLAERLGSGVALGEVFEV
jgi:hypothetical protein